MNTKQNNTRILPVFMAFFVMGFIDVVGISTAYVKSDFQLSSTMANLLPMMVFIWFALVSVPVGIFQDKYGKRRTLNIGIGITFLALLLPFFHYSYAFIILSFVLIGIGNIIIQVSANPLLYDVSKPGTYSSNMSLSQFIKAIAALLGPIIATFMATNFGNWRLIFLVFALTSIISLLWLKFTSIDEIRPKREAVTFSSTLSLLKNKYILIMVIGIMAGVGVDAGINTNIAIIMAEKFELQVEESSVGIKVYFASLIIARLIGALIQRRVRPDKFLFWSLLLSLIGFSGIFLAFNMLTMNISIGIIGLGFANLFPVIFALAIEKMPERSNEISALMIMSICGGAIFPFLMGIISDIFGPIYSMTVLVACVLYVLGMSVYIVRNNTFHESN
ncbi:MAG: MFS transporter [Bacteroidota bacterium]